MSRRRNRKESRVKMVFLLLLAVLVMGAAIYVVVTVAGKISSDYSHLDATAAEKTTDISIDTNNEPQVGWNETDQGWKYYLDKKNFAADKWMEIGGFLYHFGKDGFMTTGKWKNEGQIFNLHDTKGYLKSIETDLDYVPEKTGENLDSLVRTNAFWCYLKDGDSSDLFKTIMYRKTVENKIKPLGGEGDPERTTKNSMRAYGDYVYYLPKVKESQRSRLTDTEKGLCDKLFRMVPGRDTKELIAEQVDGYLVMGDTIYYSQGGSIHSATSGTEMPTGEAGYSVIIRDGECYLVDAMGSPVVAESGNSVNVGDRVYTIDEEGLIKDVKPGQPTINGRTYNLAGSGKNAAVTVNQGGSNTILIREKYGVQSYCIVDNQIYYSSYVDITDKGEWYSQIFKTDLDGQNKQAVSEQFPGTMSNMYYYDGEGQIYGEYFPVIWKQAYGAAAIISQDGSIYRINDSSERSGQDTDGNDMLEIVMAKDGKVTCLWKDYGRNTGGVSTGVIWSKAVELDAGEKTLLKTNDDAGAEESSGLKENSGPEGSGGPKESGVPEETNAIVRPIVPSTGVQPQTGVPPSPPVYNDPLTSPGKPGQGTVPAPVSPAPTIPPVPDTSENVQIIPIG